MIYLIHFSIFILYNVHYRFTNYTIFYKMHNFCKCNKSIKIKTKFKIFYFVTFRIDSVLTIKKNYVLHTPIVSAHIHPVKTVSVDFAIYPLKFSARLISIHDGDHEFATKFKRKSYLLKSQDYMNKPWNNCHQIEEGNLTYI